MGAPQTSFDWDLSESDLPAGMCHRDSSRWPETQIGRPTQMRRRPERVSSVHEACNCVRSCMASPKLVY